MKTKWMYLLGIVLLSACSKSQRDTLSDGIWQVNTYEFNGVNIIGTSPSTTNFTIEFTGTGDFISRSDGDTTEGYWALSENGALLAITVPNNTNASGTYDVDILEQANLEVSGANNAGQTIRIVGTR